METKTLIQAQANVLKITSLKKGDVIKMIEDGSYSGTEISYGVVIDLLNSGTSSYIQILKYKKSYNEVSAELIVYSGKKDVSIFPATIEEVSESFEKAVKSMGEKIKQSKVSLQKEIEAHAKAKEFVEGELTKKLTEASFEEVTQEDFNKLEEKKEERKKELELLNA